MNDKLTVQEKQKLLRLARVSMERTVYDKSAPDIDLDQCSARLRENGASFVTLTISGALRGCIGTLEAYQPLVQDVCEHAIAAATSDYRFPPVIADEVYQIRIEISRLSVPVVIKYRDPAELLGLIEPGVDGIVIRDLDRRATFLPQVWEKIPDAEHFLTQLCIKMGAPSNLWRMQDLRIFTYQVEEFCEE
jgi:uncharacterized protein